MTNDPVGGTAPAPARAQSRGLVWPALVVGLLAMNATIVAATVYLAGTDRSGAVEPDYYAKALRFDETVAQRAANAQLGWSAAASLEPGPLGSETLLIVALTDREGRTIEGASVRAEIFSHLRANQRQALDLRPDGAGRYAAPARVDRSGLWQVRLRIERGSTFTYETQILVP